MPWHAYFRCCAPFSAPEWFVFFAISRTSSGDGWRAVRLLGVQAVLPDHGAELVRGTLDDAFPVPWFVLTK
jgi:hypothetical protein